MHLRSTKKTPVLSNTQNSHNTDQEIKTFFQN